MLIDIIFIIIFAFCLYTDINSNILKNEKIILAISDIAFIVGSIMDFIQTLTLLSSVVDTTACIFMVLGWIVGFYERRHYTA